MSYDRVGNDGSKSARLIWIGEAPGKWEHVYGRPIVGPSYTNCLLPWWNDVGLDRSMFFITNVLDYDPTRLYRGHPDNPAINFVPQGEMLAAFDRLHATLAELDDPWVIIPNGNYALYALTGHGKVSWHMKDGRHARPGITDWRGSILTYEDRRGRRIKVIPVVHPAATFNVPWYERVCRADWERIAGDQHFRELRTPERTHIIAPSASEAIEWIRWTQAEGQKAAKSYDVEVAKHGIEVMLDQPYAAVPRRLAMSLDVETPRKIEYETRQAESTATNAKCRGCGHTKRWHFALKLIGDLLPASQASMCTKKGLKKDGAKPCDCMAFQPVLGKPKRIKIADDPYLGCIGYAWDVLLSMTIPTTLSYWQDPAVWAVVKAAMAELHADPYIDKVTQNGPFDGFWGATEGLPVSGTWYDLLWMHRVRCPSDEAHDLAFQASLYTRQPYWKDEAKDPDSIAKYAHNNDALWTYNGIDNCVQRELFPIHWDALLAGGRLLYYLRMDYPMMPALTELSLVGVRADIEGRAAKFIEVRAQASEVGAAINTAAGTKLVAKVAVSVKKMKAWLYGNGEGELRLPPQYAKNSKKKKVVSCDVVSIKRLMERFPSLTALQEVGTRVIKHRRLNTVANYVKAERISADGRQYGLFKQDTLLGRLSCSSTPRDEGANLQNMDRKVRQFYLPDRGDEPGR